MLGWALLSALAVLAVLAAVAPAQAQVREAPIGGRPIPLGDDLVACETAPGGWALEAGGRAVRPPAASQSDAIGRASLLRVAPRGTSCAEEGVEMTLVATERLPEVEDASITFWPDEGRLEARGRNLEGATVVWSRGDVGGSDECRDPRSEGGTDRCTWAVGRGGSAVPTGTRFVLLPRGAREEAEAVQFDANGRQVTDDLRTIVPARVILSRLVPVDAAVDLASGQGEVPLVHPEAIASAECSVLKCEMVNGKLVVRGAPNLVSTMDLRVRLVPHVFLMRRELAETQVSLKLPVMHCPLSIVSGPPVRGNDEAKVVVELAESCARDLASLSFQTDTGPLKVLKAVQDEGMTYVLLRLGRVDDDSIAVSAMRGEPEPIALAVAHAPTRAAPTVRSTLELPGYPNLGFIPNNVDATVHVSPAGDHEHFALLPIEGVYSVLSPKGRPPLVRGDPNAAGLTELRFGLRNDRLPEGLDQADLAVVADPLQRSVDQANIPAPLHTLETRPLVEVLCGGERVLPGDTAHLPFKLRDNCRVIFHRERLSPEYGVQKLRFEVDVFTPDGAARGEAHISEVVTMRHGTEPRTAFVRGVTTPFDRVVVRIAHEPDESHYIGGAELKTGAPEAQWSIVLGTGRARLYATTTIPTGLYRFGASKSQSGVLSLNFGVISRLTWLDEEGHEGFLGAEAGVLVFGLANSTSETGRSLTQVGAVLGIGVSVPIANRSSLTQASINLHAWLESDLTGDSSKGESRWAFIFGPSISIGNVGLNL